MEEFKEIVVWKKAKMKEKRKENCLLSNISIINKQKKKKSKLKFKKN